MVKKKTSKLFLKIIILLLCAYQLDINKNHVSKLSNNKICSLLEINKIDNNIIKYGISEFNLEGFFYYYRNKADTECMILINKKEINVIFIGTETTNGLESLIKDFITDFNLGILTIDIDVNNVGIHKPYKKNMEQSNFIYKIINIILKYNNKKLIISGHSAGCGGAVYLSIILNEKYNYKKKLKLVLISSPKLGNKNLAKYIENNDNIKLYTMINNYELPPLFPFYPFFPSYSNVGNKIYRYKNDGTCEILKSMPANFFIYSSIKDHLCISSIKNVFTNIIEK